MRKLSKLGFLFGVVFLSVAGEARAQSIIDSVGRYVPDDAVQVFLADALSKVGREKCERDLPCTPASQKDIDHPPITLIDGRAAMAHGMISAMAQWCGLDWKRSFFPMLAFGRHKMKMTDRQLVLMTLMHGNMQARQLPIYKSGGACPERLRTQLDTQMPRL